MRSRCHREGRPEATAFPHYIGTLDAFIWDILVEPHHPAGSPLQRLDSWDRVQAEVKLDRQIPLSTFTFQRNTQTGRDSIRRDLMKDEYQRLIESSRFPWEVWENSALKERKAQYESGYVTGHEIRHLAFKYLALGQEVEDPLRSRFAEIVVDEAQDCSVTDLEILDRLHNTGIPIVVVADPDQMIYGWRDADLRQLSALTEKLGQTVELIGNWRSSTTVCRLAATLRDGSRPPDPAIRPPVPEPPVILLPTDFPKGRQARHTTSRQAVVDVFLSHAQNYGILPEDCLITSYKKTHLPTRRRQPAGNPAAQLAFARQVIHSGTADPDLLDSALLIAGRRLLRYWYPDVAARGSLHTRCERAGIAHSDLIRYAYAFLFSLPAAGASWLSDVNTKLKTSPRPSTARPKGTTGQLRSRPDTASPSGDPGGQHRVANIAQVKGDEHLAVLLLLPDSDTSTRWISGHPATDELLRNWYVAVTRAQKLVAIATRANQIQQLSEYLDTQQIPTLVY